MNPGEHAAMAEVEATHWWYLGLRDAMAQTFSRYLADLPPAPRVLDAGCGTGANLKFLRERLAPSYLGGFDLSDDALGYARQMVADADLSRGDICDPAPGDGGLDLIISMDVIYIPGAAHARDGLRRLCERLEPGGAFVLNLPAYAWLYSEHDQAVHTSQRFTTGEVATLLDGLGLSIQLLTYRLCLLFPLLVLSRLPSMWRARRHPDAATRSELHDPPGPAINHLLFRAMHAENRLLGAGVRLPWGSSVYAIARKR